MTPEELLAQLTHRDLPPVHRWHPKSCSDIDIRIARDGQWYHEGAPIRRRSLVELFSTVLRRDQDGQYFLVTPSEKLRIRVDDAPFLAVDVDAAGNAEEQVLVFTTNVGDQVVVDSAHPIRVEVNGRNGGPAPYVRVRDELDALIARPAYYRLVMLGEERGDAVGVWSRGQYFVLGVLES